MVDGFLVIDKPAGISSHDVVNRVRRILGTRKVGHTGTLDPFATGVLPIAVGEGTKAIQFLDEGKKSYEAVLHFGVVTDTLDCTGAILQQQDAAYLTREQLEQQMVLLTGQIEQIPPMYSALKQGGQPLYKLARKGVEVERPPRQVVIYRFDLCSFEPPFARVKVDCSRGTYIRTLADDLGRLVGCGACLDELRRNRSGPFSLSTALTLEQLAQSAAQGTVRQQLVAVSSAVDHLAPLYLNHQEQERLKNGVPPRQSLLDKPAGLYRLMHADRLMAVAEVGPDSAVSLKRVFN